MNSTPLPYRAPPHTHGLGTRQPSVPLLETFQNAVLSLSIRKATLVTNFVFSQCNIGVNK